MSEIIKNKYSDKELNQFKVLIEEKIEKAKRREQIMKEDLEKQHEQVKKLKTSVVGLLKSEKDLKDKVETLEKSLAEAEKKLKLAESELKIEKEKTVEVPGLKKELARRIENEQALKYALIGRGV